MFVSVVSHVIGFGSLRIHCLQRAEERWWIRQANRKRFKIRSSQVEKNTKQEQKRWDSCSDDGERNGDGMGWDGRTNRWSSMAFRFCLDRVESRFLSNRVCLLINYKLNWLPTGTVL